MKSATFWIIVLLLGNLALTGYQVAAAYQREQAQAAALKQWREFRRLADRAADHDAGRMKSIIEIGSARVPAPQLRTDLALVDLSAELRKVLDRLDNPPPPLLPAN